MSWPKEKRWRRFCEPPDSGGAERDLVSVFRLLAVPLPPPRLDLKGPEILGWDNVDGSPPRWMPTSVNVARPLRTKPSDPTAPIELDDADDLLTRYEPDVLGLIEFPAKRQARELMFSRFPEYAFAVTDSSVGLEMIVGFKRGVFKQVIWTQKLEFNNTRRTLRPGALVSVNYANEWYSLLFLHTKSGYKRSSNQDRWTVFDKI